ATSTCSGRCRIRWKKDDAPSERAVRVAERMTRTVVTIRRDTTATTAWALMKVRRLRHLPVVDDRGRVVGIVSERDLARVPFTRIRAGHAVPVGLPVRRSMSGLV